MALVWKMRHGSVTGAALTALQAGAAAAIGAISWSGHLAGLFLAPLLVYLWGKSGSKTRAFIIAFCYYLAAGHGLIAGAGVFFGESAILPKPIPGMILWAGYSALLAAVWGGFWGCNRKPGRLFAALVAVSIPPLGVIGGYNPLLASGAYFPGLGWTGLALTLAWALVLAQGWRPLALTLPFALIALGANVLYVEPALPNWSARDTSLGPAVAPEAQYDRMMSLQRIVTSWSSTSAHGAVLVLPELVGDDWSINSQWWDRADAKLKAREQTVLVGAYVPIGTGEMYENVIVTLGNGKGVTWRDRVPVPISMWKPLSGKGARTFWAEREVKEIAGKRVASLVCYEQLLMWPVLLSLLDKPEVLIAPANDWWASETNLPELQRQSVRAWARSFSIPSFWSTNR